MRLNVLVIDEKEGVNPCHMLGASGIPRANALSEMIELIGIQVHGLLVRGFVTGIARGRVKDQQGQGDISLQKGGTKKSKTVRLCCCHVMCGTETLKPQYFVRATKGFGCRDVVLDAFMV